MQWMYTHERLNTKILYTRLLLVRRMLVVNERLLPTRVYFKMVLL